MDLELLRRNSQISVDSCGVFHHEGAVIENARIQQLFRRGLRVREDGEVTLHVGQQWCYVAVQEVPLYVDRIGVEPNADGIQGVWLHLSDETVETLDPQTLTIVGEERIFCWVKEGCVPARFLRSAHHALGELLIEAPESPDGIALQVDGKTHVIRQVDTGPVWPPEGTL